MFYNENCITGCQNHIKDNSIDLIVTDPPYGINGDKLDKHYNRKEDFVIDGYIEVPQDEYQEFSLQWIKEAARILKPGGSIYIVSGYTNLVDILNGLRQTDLKEMNHIIWKYNFGVYTKKKYVSSHYHILYYTKLGAPHTFNTFSRYGETEKDKNNGSLNYQDREDVWIINREYKHGQIKNKNELPKQLLTKIIQYSTNPGDTVCDLFLGSFSAAKVAIGLDRDAIGFEKSKKAYEYQLKEMQKIKRGYLLSTIRDPQVSHLFNQGRPWSDAEKTKVNIRYVELINEVKTKKRALPILSKEFGRGIFSLIKIIEN